MLSLTFKNHCAAVLRTDTEKGQGLKKICWESTIIIQRKDNHGFHQRGKCRGDGDWSDPGQILKVEWIAFLQGLDMIYGGNKGIKDDSNILS